MKHNNLPKDFDWKFYLKKNKDLTIAGLNTEEDAINHYLNNGQFENRKYSNPQKNINITKLFDDIETLKYIDFEFFDENIKKIEHNENNKIVFTICASNYLAQAKSLGDSLLKYNKDYLFVIFLIDHVDTSINIEHEIIEISNINIPNVNEMFINYDVTEFSTSVKPFCFNYLFKKYTENIVIYLDPDILIYDKLTKLEEILKNKDIILTPHITKPLYDDFYPSEQTILNAGIYNLGFLALKKTENVLSFLEWWSFKMQKFCKIDFCNGMFVDQLFINFVPLYFNSVEILDNPGYNIAYWNLHERIVSKRNNNYFVNEKNKLVFFHFSGYKFDDEISVHNNRFYFTERNDLIELFLDYKKTVYENNYNFFSKLKYKPKLPSNSNGVNLCGFINQNFSLSIVCKTIKKTLDHLELNYNVNEIISEGHGYEKKINSSNINNYNKNLLVFNPDTTLDIIESDYMKNKYNIGIWFWELSDLPNSWVKNSILYNEVWATSNFLYELFKKKLPNNLKINRINYPIIPPKKIDKKVAKKEFGINEDEFLCLFVFDYYSCPDRKNPFAVIETFKLTFKDNEKCKLIIKSQNGSEDDLKKINELTNGDLRIIHINETYNDEKTNILMNSSDVYISLHRSEGLGLTLMESILLEKPTICTNYSGNIDFCLPEWSELVNYKLIPVESEIYISMYGDQTEIFWADPYVSDASIKLKKIYDNYEEYQNKAKIGKKWILDNYSYINFQNQIYNLLN